METYQIRMIDEERELGIRIDKLRSFLFGTERDVALLPPDKEVMREQLKVMDIYRSILVVRINAFKAKLWDESRVAAALDFPKSRVMEEFPKDLRNAVDGDRIEHPEREEKVFGMDDVPPQEFPEAETL